MNTKYFEYNTILRHAIQTALRSGLLFACLSTASFALGLGVNITPDTLIVTSSYFTGTTQPIIAGTTQLPGTNATTKVAAVHDSSYPSVFLNAGADASFGITSPIYLSTVNSGNGFTIKNVNLTAIAAASGVDFVTSFSSKSELAINLSTDGTSAFTLVGYSTVSGLLDISNSNSFYPVDTTNPTYGFSPETYRTVLQLNKNGSWQVTPTNGYSGNNGRTAILDSAHGYYFLAGNAGNAGKPAPNGTFLSELSNNTGVQTIAVGSGNPTTTVIGQAQGTLNSSTGYQRGFSVGNTNPLTGLPYGAVDKTGKDDNFRGATAYNGTLYVSKGSGGNGINTVYQVGNVGDFGTGNLDGNSPITVLPGLPTQLASGTPTYFPFGMWFANPTTLYVADEGGTAFPYVATGHEGIQKWVFESDGQWHNVYTLQNSLGLGVPYTVTGTAMDGSSGNYTTTTSGLRHLIGSLHTDGTVTLYATTSTVSNPTVYGDQGADPNRLVSIKDVVSAQTQPSNENFTLLKTAAYGQVLRGVNILPQSVAFALPQASTAP